MFTIWTKIMINFILRHFFCNSLMSNWINTWTKIMIDKAIRLSYLFFRHFFNDFTIYYDRHMDKNCYRFYEASWLSYLIYRQFFDNFTIYYDRYMDKNCDRFYDVKGRSYLFFGIFFNDNYFGTRFYGAFWPYLIFWQIL